MQDHSVERQSNAIIYLFLNTQGRPAIKTSIKDRLHDTTGDQSTI